MELGARHTRYGRTWLYEATVRPDVVLAYLEPRGEGWTVIINPAGLSQIKRREEMLPQCAFSILVMSRGAGGRGAPAARDPASATATRSTCGAGG